jgi:hypothetical protein
MPSLLSLLLLVALSSGGGVALMPTASFLSTFKNSVLMKRVVTRLRTAVQDTIVTSDLQQVIRDGPIPMNERCFVINGWRWHTSSVIRDLERFKAVLQDVRKSRKDLVGFAALSTSSLSAEAESPAASISSSERLLGCYNFAVGFNWKALMRVEAEIFFPWLQKLLPASARSLMSDIIKQHSDINVLSNSMLHQCNNLLKNKDDVHAELASYKRIEELLAEMQECALRIQSVQDSVFVPYIAAFVSHKEQEVFNRMVINRLGVLDSQVHLVSMYDTICGIPKELKLYEDQIPRVLRAVLPVWRKRLYLPRAKFLSLDRSL